MSESEDVCEPFEDSGSEYEPSFNGSEADEESLNNDEQENDFEQLEHVIQDHIIEDLGHETNNNDAVENNNSGGNDNELVVQSHQKTRKRKLDAKTWKKNKRKMLRQSGQEYLNSKGRKVPQKRPRNRCSNCRFQCTTRFSEEDVALIHEEFWKNNDSEKGFFYDKTTERHFVQRQRNRGERKKTKCYFYKYYFFKECEKIRVCKQFYLGVLDVSQIRISYFHENRKEGFTNTPARDKRGSETGKKISEEIRKSIRQHINLFPRIPSHYCRKNSSREYLERSLSLAKMYDLYVEYCNEQNYVPAKKWLYYNIFNFEFNISFEKPKKDLCEICTEFELKNMEGNLTDELKLRYEKHIIAKNEAREEKEKDIKASKDEAANQAIICFDMQSVLTCPQTQISKAYYKKKFAVYNLTGCDVVKKQGYCVIWTELLGGRKGEDIASALFVLLEKFIADRPDVTNLILWSDACVPQNKNSHMTSALLYFLKMHPNIKSITQKFQEPGHSCVQEVDAMHDRHLNKLELHSPLAIIKAILKTRSKKPYKVIQLNKNHFKEFKAMSQLMVLSNIPYKSLSEINYENNSNYMSYKMTFTTSQNRVYILKRTRQSSNKTFLQDIPPPTIQALPPPLPPDKIQHIKSLSNNFSKVDLQYWKAIIPKF